MADHDPDARLTLELLGSTRLIRAIGQHAAEIHVLERRDAAMLALLAVEGESPRARLVSLLWPDSDAKHGSASLRQRLFRLKRWAGRELVAGDKLLALAPDIAHDLHGFAEQGRIDLNRSVGDLLGSVYYGDCGELGEWVDKARDRWRAARRQALADQATALEDAGDLNAALDCAERLVQDDPSAERAHRRVMQLHYLRGDRSAALAAFERCQRRLKRDLKVEPGPQTVQLAATISRSGDLQQRSPAPQVPLPTALRRPPQLIAREVEWACFDRAVAQGCAVLLEGEAGSGKSRLLTDYAQARHWPAPAGARPGDEAVPYALAARWLDRLSSAYRQVALDPAVSSELARVLPRLADPQNPPVGLLDPARLQQAMQAALNAWQPLAARATTDATPGLALDDLQFADSASLALLLELASATSLAGWVWLMAFRSGAAPNLPRQWLERCSPGQTVHLALAPLDEAAVGALLASLQLPGLVADEWARPMLAYCGGHPFYVIDALASLHVEGQHDFSGPPRLPARPLLQQSSLARRIGQLPADAQQLAHVAAVAGQDFGVELAAMVLGCAPVALAAPWKALEQAGLFRSGGFAHDLVRQAMRADLPEAIGRALHRQIAAWLSSESATLATPRAARIAAHWEAAGEMAAAAASFERSALEARARSARREELQALTAAARNHRAAQVQDSDDAAFDCDWRSAHLLLSLESSDVALQHADALLQRAATVRQRAAALEVRARVLSERVEPEAALVDARAASALAAQAGAERLQLLASQRAATALMRLSRPDEAVLEQQAAADALQSLDAEERLYWLSDHATALDYADRRVEALQIFDRAIEHAGQVGHWSAASEAWGNKAIALMYLNRMHDSMFASRQAIECGRRAGTERGNLLIDEMTLAGSLRDLGEFDSYLDIAQGLPQALREVGYPFWASNAENDLAICFLWLGRPEIARRTLTPVGDEVPVMMRASRLFTRARLARGRPVGPGEEGAAALVRRAHALVEQAGGTGRSYVRLKIALELARDDDAPEALLRVAAIEAEALEREQFMLAMHALMLRTELLTRAGASAQAGQAGRDLFERCTRGGAPPALYTPEVWWVAHKALAPVDPNRAAEALRRAAGWIELTALPRVPEVFRKSFLERNPVNLEVLAAARQVAIR